MLLQNIHAPRKQTAIPSIARIVLPPKSRDRSIEEGMEVREGQRLTKDEIFPSVHASIPGVITRISSAIHSFGHEIEIIEILLKGRFEFYDRREPFKEWELISIEDHITFLKHSGVTTLPDPSGTEAIIIDVCESEPGLRHNIALFQEYQKFFIQHIPFIKHLFQTERVFLCLDEAIKNVRGSIEKEMQSRNQQGCFVKVVPRYKGIPYCNDFLLKWSCKVAEQRSKVVSFESLMQILEAILYQRPVQKQTVFVYGDALTKERFLCAHIGSSLSDLLAESEMYTSSTDSKIVLNGMFTGIEIENLNQPLDQSIHSISIHKRVETDTVRPCISCGLCTTICPAHLEPNILYNLIESENTSYLRDMHIDRCISCGLCSYVCPSRIPLTQQITRNKQLLMESKGKKM